MVPIHAVFFRKEAAHEPQNDPFDFQGLAHFEVHGRNARKVVPGGLILAETADLCRKLCQNPPRMTDPTKFPITVLGRTNALSPKTVMERWPPYPPPLHYSATS